MSNKISLRQLFDDPKLWLEIPHDRHEWISELMLHAFGGRFGEKLEQIGCHCYQCDGMPMMITEDDEIVIGHIDWPERIYRTIRL
jgi:hypothetical protein